MVQTKTGVHLPWSEERREQERAKHVLSLLSRRNGGPFTSNQTRTIAADIMGLPKKFQFRDLSAAQCRDLIFRLIVLGLV